MHVQSIANTQDILGETPVWCADEQALYWVDVRRPAVHRCDTRTAKVATWAMPELVGSLALCVNGDVLVALRSSVRRFNPATEKLELVAAPESGNPQMRLNDGRVDRRGRFWVGSMNDVTRGPEGTLYRLDGSGGCVPMLGEIFVPNSLAWSPDSRTMYFAGPDLRTVFAYDFEPESGTMSNRRVFAEYAAPAFPDGATVDADGYLWCAAYEGWRITRYAPDGRIDRVIEVPVQCPTAVTFGGSDMMTLFVTTARQRIAEEALAKQPLAGAVLALDVGIAGIAEPRFIG